MATSDELSGFLKEGLSSGLSRDRLEEVLLASGWPSDEVRSALNGFADVDFPIPVPRPRPYVSAREAFIYLVLFSSLYASAFSLGSLLFLLIDRAFPDPSADPAAALAASRVAIRWSISWLVVTFPVFVVATWRNERALRADPGRRLSRVRRWLTYLTLFVAASILVGDLTTIVYNVLSGEVTARFILKVLTVATISGTVLVHLARSVRTDGGAP